jgi:hypothetical protein
MNRWRRIDSFIPGSDVCAVPFRVLSFRAENAYAIVDLDAAFLRWRMKRIWVDGTQLVDLMDREGAWRGP